jgi:hypothetical protein
MTRPGWLVLLASLAFTGRAAAAPSCADQLATLVKKCQCKPSADRVASILWKLAFQNLGVLVAVTTKDIASLPWGGAKATWADAAPAVVKALGR